MAASPSRPAHSRALRWSLAGAGLAALLAIYWFTLDRIATRVGQDAEATFRSLPVNEDTRHRSD